MKVSGAVLSVVLLGISPVHSFLGVSTCLRSPLDTATTCFRPSQLKDQLGNSYLDGLIPPATDNARSSTRDTPPEIHQQNEMNSAKNTADRNGHRAGSIHGAEQANRDHQKISNSMPRVEDRIDADPDAADESLAVGDLTNKENDVEAIDANEIDYDQNVDPKVIDVVPAGQKLENIRAHKIGSEVGAPPDLAPKPNRVHFAEANRSTDGYSYRVGSRVGAPPDATPKPDAQHWSNRETPKSPYAQEVGAGVGKFPDSTPKPDSLFAAKHRASSSRFAPEVQSGVGKYPDPTPKPDFLFGAKHRAKSSRYAPEVQSGVGKYPDSKPKPDFLFASKHRAKMNPFGYEVGSQVHEGPVNLTPQPSVFDKPIARYKSRGGYSSVVDSGTIGIVPNGDHLSSFRPGVYEASRTRPHSAILGNQQFSGANLFPILSVFDKPLHSEANRHFSSVVGSSVGSIPNGDYYSSASRLDAGGPSQHRRMMNERQPSFPIEPPFPIPPRGPPRENMRDEPHLPVPFPDARVGRRGSFGRPPHGPEFDRFQQERPPFQPDNSGPNRFAREDRVSTRNDPMGWAAPRERSSDRQEVNRAQWGHTSPQFGTDRNGSRQTRNTRRRNEYDTFFRDYENAYEMTNMNRQQGHSPRMPPRPFVDERELFNDHWNEPPNAQFPGMRDSFRHGDFARRPAGRDGFQMDQPPRYHHPGESGRTHRPPYSSVVGSSAGVAPNGDYHNARADPRYQGPGSRMRPASVFENRRGVRAQVGQSSKWKQTATEFESDHPPAAEFKAGDERASRYSNTDARSRGGDKTINSHPPKAQNNDFPPTEASRAGLEAHGQSGFSGRPGENPPGCSFEPIEVDTGAWDVWNGKGTNVKSEVPSVSRSKQQPREPATARTKKPSRQEFYDPRRSSQRLVFSDDSLSSSSSSRGSDYGPHCTFERIKVDTGVWDDWSS